MCQARPTHSFKGLKEERPQIGSERNSLSSKEGSTIEMSILGRQAGGKEESPGHLRRRQLRMHRGTGEHPSLCQRAGELFGFSDNLWKRAPEPKSRRGPSGRDESVGSRVQAGKEQHRWAKLLQQ